MLDLTERLCSSGFIHFFYAYTRVLEFAGESVDFDFKRESVYPCFGVCVVFLMRSIGVILLFHCQFTARARVSSRVCVTGCSCSDLSMHIRLENVLCAISDDVREGMSK